ncbi:MAG: membrane-binding protein [Bacteroidota bacterium]
MIQHTPWIGILFIALLGCTERSVQLVPSATESADTYLAIPDGEIEKSELFYDREKSLWTWNNQVYSGYAVSYHGDGTLKEKFGILEGRKQNQAIHWYPDGHYERAANYHMGKLHGDKKTWSADTAHTLLSHLQYVAGKAHGEQKIWYPTGELFKKLHLNMGQEEGLQQAFRKNGALFAKYEALDGRIFGLKKAALCFGLSDENIQYGR